MQPAPMIYEQPDEVERRLATLGVPRDVLDDVLRQGELQRRMASPFDPPSAPGFAAWARRVRVLREQMWLRGWFPSDRDNYSTVVSADGMTAIAVATGDEITGTSTPECDPRTKYPRGPATSRAVDTNVQLALFPLPDVPADPSHEGTVTWILLTHSSDDAVFAELSCPRVVGDDGRVIRWSERILLGRVDLDGGEGLGLPEEPDEPAPEAPIVSVQRRNA